MAKESGTPALKSTRVFGDYLLMLIVPAVMSIWYYGSAAVFSLLTCVVTSIVADFIASMVIYRQYYIADFSAPVTGAMIALMMPASCPYYVEMLACLFAVLVIKIPFGGGMRAPFVPAAAGFASAAVCFKDLVFTYSGGRDYMNTASIASTLLSNGSMKLTTSTVLDILTGNFYGPMGTGCVIIFLGCIIFMLIRRKDSLLSTAGFLAVVIMTALVFPRTSGTRISSLVLELSSGSLLFASVFLLTDYSTLPKHNINRVVYGAFTGILCMVMRHLGAYEEPVCFAILLGNAFSPVLDTLTDYILNLISSKSKKKEVNAN